MVDQFGKKSAEYQAFFPQGLTIYYVMTYPEVESRLDILISAVRPILPAVRSVEVSEDAEARKPEAKDTAL